MIAAIRSERVPNLFLLEYSIDWSVRNFLVIPNFFITESIVEKRKPLGPKARRHGWIGCSILIGGIPVDGRIRIVSNGIPVDPQHVRSAYLRTLPLGSLDLKVRGWTLDVLSIIRALRMEEFSLSQVYAFEEELRARHPHNKNVRPKIRQQLQILRDLGFLRFQGSGRYTLSSNLLMT